jgi:hypothetical protein
MTRSTRAKRWVAALALAAPLAAQATSDSGVPRTDQSRMLYATDSGGNLISFRAGSPSSIRSSVPLTGLPAGVRLVGIDFRPATGDLYSVGTDNVVYRVNPFTGIAIAEGPAFTPALRGVSFGVDFNPTVDKIRLTSDANQNMRLNPDEGTVLSSDPDLNPGDPNVVGSAYTESSFNATRPTTTVLYAVDSASDMLFQQNPANAGTLVNGLSLGVDIGDDAGFDIAGAGNVGYLVATPAGALRALRSGLAELGYSPPYRPVSARRSARRSGALERSGWTQFADPCRACSPSVTLGPSRHTQLRRRGPRGAQRHGLRATPRLDGPSSAAGATSLSGRDARRRPGSSRGRRPA